MSQCEPRRDSGGVRAQNGGPRGEAEMLTLEELLVIGGSREGAQSFSPDLTVLVK